MGWGRVDTVLHVTVRGHPRAEDKGMHFGLQKVIFKGCLAWH